VGTARILEQMGFEALATTSAGFAFSRGKSDGQVGREAMLTHVAEIAAATDLPVSGDLENGYGDDPDTAAEAIRMAAAAGLVGGSIEDATGRSDEPIYALEHAVERVRAAVEAGRALPFTFTLTARAENYLHRRPDLKDTIRRLQLFQDAGADVLYAPGLTTREEIAAVLGAVDRPVNVLMGMAGIGLSMAELSEMGVKRVSTGGALARAALGALMEAAREMREQGTFGFTSRAADSRELHRMFGG
jgi:2-methylisocitrate lyase-like PEP mutase family enzyme